VKKYRAVTCGVYDTHYTVRDYGDKIVVSCPYIRWENNSGALGFKIHTVSTQQGMALVRAMVDNEELFIGVDTNCAMESERTADQ